MILASVLALFYRAAIGSQQELKIMTVGENTTAVTGKVCATSLAYERQDMSLIALAAWVCCLLIYFPLFSYVLGQGWLFWFCVLPPSAEQ